MGLDLEIRIWCATLHAAILAQACNFGLTTMADIADLTYCPLAWIGGGIPERGVATVSKVPAVRHGHRLSWTTIRGLKNSLECVSAAGSGANRHTCQHGNSFMLWRPRRATSDERIQAELAKLKQSLSAEGLRRSLARAILGSDH